MKKRKKRLLQNIVLLLIVIVIFFVFFEITLRVLNVSSGYDYPKWMYQKDDLLGFRMTPNFKGEIIKPEFKTRIRTNSQGLRDIEYGKKVEGEYRILGIGASYTWGGYGIELEDTFLKVLEKKLNEGGNKSFSVINAGVPGYNTKQKYLYLNENGFKYEPDMVLLSISLKDFEDNSIDIEDIVIKEGVKVSNKAETRTVYKIRSFLLLNFWSYRLIERKIANMFGNFVQRWVNKELQDKGVVVGLFLKNTPPNTEEAVELTYGFLDEINDFVKEKNITLVLLLIAEKYQVDENLKLRFVESNNFNLNYLDFEKPQRIVKDWAEKNDVLVIDMLPELRAKNNDNDFYWSLNPHFNKEGHVEVANMIFNKLKTYELVD